MKMITIIKLLITCLFVGGCYGSIRTPVASDIHDDWPIPAWVLEIRF